MTSGGIKNFINSVMTERQFSELGDIVVVNRYSGRKVCFACYGLVVLN